MKEVEGIVIDERDYKETSKILILITKEFGLINILSQGCKKMKSTLRSVSSKFTYGKFVINYKENKLSTLIEVSVINNFRNIKTDIDKISYATYLLELSKEVIKHNNSSIYNDLIQGLIKINDGYDPVVIMNILELKFLDYLGVMPTLDECVVCGRKTNIVTISSYLGGLVCNSCYKNEYVYSNKTIKLIRMFYYVDISKITKLEINDKYKIEINRFLDDYYSRYTGIYLKSKKFIQNLQKLKSTL